MLAREPVALEDAAHAVASAVRDRAAQRGVAVEVRGGHDALADPAAVRRVLAALLDNAVRFTERGRVAVAVAGDAVVTVSDTGIGMSPSFLAVATEPFRQASEGDARAYEGGRPGSRARPGPYRADGRGAVDRERRGARDHRHRAPPRPRPPRRGRPAPGARRPAPLAAVWRLRGGARTV